MAKQCGCHHWSENRSKRGPCAFCLEWQRLLLVAYRIIHHGGPYITDEREWLASAAPYVAARWTMAALGVIPMTPPHEPLVPNLEEIERAVQHAKVSLTIEGLLRAVYKMGPLISECRQLRQQLDLAQDAHNDTEHELAKAKERVGELELQLKIFEMLPSQAAEDAALMNWVSDWGLAGLPIVQREGGFPTLTQGQRAAVEAHIAKLEAERDAAFDAGVEAAAFVMDCTPWILEPNRGTLAKDIRAIKRGPKEAE